MAWMGVPAALNNRLWARLRARNAVSSFMVFSKSARCSSLKGCTYLMIITSSGRGEYATKSGLTLMRYCISIVSKNFWSGTYQCLASCLCPWGGDIFEWGEAVDVLWQTLPALPWSCIGRVQEHAADEIDEERPVTAAAQAAGVRGAGLLRRLGTAPPHGCRRRAGWGWWPRTRRTPRGSRRSWCWSRLGSPWKRSWG